MKKMMMIESDMMMVMIDGDSNGICSPMDS
jgi:hypothetical protein